MNTREHCVLIAPVLPNPDGSGLEQRSFSLLRNFAARFDVTLVVANGEPSLPAIPSAVESLATGIHHLHTRPASRLGQRAARLIPLLVLLEPRWTADWQQAAAPLTILHAPSHAVFFRLRMHSLRAALFPTEQPPNTFIDLDDRESTTLWSIGCCALRRLRLRLALKHLSMACQYALLERTVLRRYNTVTYANPVDGQALANISGNATLLCRPNQVRLPDETPRPPAEAPFTLLFVGTLGYFPNEDAALWLADELVPALRLQAQVPFRLLIAGRCATQRLITRLASIPEIEFLGPVEHVAPLYAQSHVAVAAVRCGGGTKVKVLEAVAHQCPVVATPHSALGLPFLPAEDLLTASDAAFFAASCLRLARHPDQARAMARNAHLRLSASSSNAATGSSSTPSSSR
jgi:glycosyltransferase involved in cell wall biosynthesis